MNSPVNIVFNSSKSADEPIDNIGVGLGYNFEKSTLYFGIVNKKVMTVLNLPSSTIDGNSPMSSYTPNLIQSSAADVNVIPSFLKVNFSPNNQSSVTDKKQGNNGYKFINKTKLGKKLELNIRESLNPNLDINIPFYKVWDFSFERIDINFELKPNEIKTGFNLIKDAIEKDDKEDDKEEGTN